MFVKEQKLNVSTRVCGNINEDSKSQLVKQYFSDKLQ